MKWKADTLAYLYPQVIGLIDDTLDIFSFSPSSYQGAIFLYGKTNYPLSVLTVIPCKTWDDVYMKVTEHKASLQRTAEKSHLGTGMWGAGSVTQERTDATRYRKSR